MNITDTVVDAIHERAQRIKEEQGYYFIGQYEDETYYNLNTGHVKTRASATRMLSDSFFVKNNIKAIKVKCRKSSTEKD